MFSFYVRGQALWIWMALLSVVTYEPHRIYKHCDTRKRAYCAVRACLHSISKTVGSFRVKEAPLSSLMAHWRNLKRGRTLLLMAPASFLLFVVCFFFPDERREMHCGWTRQRFKTPPFWNKCEAQSISVVKTGQVCVFGPLLFLDWWRFFMFLLSSSVANLSAGPAQTPELKNRFSIFGIHSLAHAFKKAPVKTLNLAAFVEMYVLCIMCSCPHAVGTKGSLKVHVEHCMDADS